MVKPSDFICPKISLVCSFLFFFFFSFSLIPETYFLWVCMQAVSYFSLGSPEILLHYILASTVVEKTAVSLIALYL